MRNDPLVRAVLLLDVPLRRFAVAIAAGVVALGSGLALAALAAWLIARAWQMPPVLDLSIAVVSVRALGISRGIFRYLERLASHDAALRGTTNARTAIYRRLAEGNPATVTGLRKGDLLVRTGVDVDAVGAVVVRAIVPMAVAAVLATAAVVLSACISLPAATVLAGSAVFAGVVAPWVGARSARQAEQAAAFSRAAAVERGVVALDHAAELRVAGKLDGLLDDTRRKRMRSVALFDRAAFGSALAAAAQPLAISVSLVAALAFGILAYASAADMSPMALAVLVLLPLAAFEALGPMPETAQELTRARIAATRLMAMLDAAETACDDAGTVAVPPSVAVRAEGLVCGRNGGRQTRAIDLDFFPGSRTAIVGASGAGKTTLLMTLAGILPAMAGSVMIDELPIENFDSEQLRTDIGFFAEDAHLFDTSLLENLRVSNGNLTEPAAMSILDAVGLSGWVSALPEGLHTRLTGGAKAVSGGQRRRILLARALASPARVLLLDEPTEHLDNEDGADLLRSLLDRRCGLVAADRTVVVVTHQLPSDTHADRVHTVEAAPAGRPSRTGPSPLVADRPR
ncbi:thiol reductant ABC exporter subunit CydC [Antrihabitans sp. YC3-6]|uniref:Thiol reductant ABC exporter subunit CydC n=1 Tax=Antrihabitans stalagmiti TaxID=2799499 RepID=A0A934NTJ0_9NOCA|nr:thiol reductant ABC exporter subunit CydC [Antrihabitans stalagmiti]MBJ8341278.1 thiol reductant ABC exporter subunit CydC [Antrihabitans stalagmiti]